MVENKHKHELPSQFEVSLHSYPSHQHYAIRSLITAWMDVLCSYKDIPFEDRRHPAISTVKIPFTRYIIDVKINNIYLEKQSIMWWSLPRLNECIRCGGSSKHDILRAAFIPLLSVIIEKFQGSPSEKFTVQVQPWIQSQLKKQLPHTIPMIDNTTTSKEDERVDLDQ